MDGHFYGLTTDQAKSCRFSTRDAATQLVLTTWANGAAVLDLVRAGITRQQPALSANGATVDLSAHFYGIGGVPYSKAAEAGNTLPAGTVPQNKWSAFLVSEDATGTVTITAAAANFTTGYDDEATALAALPATPAGEFAAVAFTVHAQNDAAGWVSGTNDVNGAQTQAFNTYPLRSADGVALTLNVDDPITGVHNPVVNIALSGAVDGDMLCVRATAGTVGGDALTGDVAVIEVTDGGLADQAKADVQAEGEDALTAFGAALEATAQQIATKTDNLPADPASATGPVGSVTGNVGGNVAGTVAGVTPAAAGAQMDLVNAPNATAVTAINAAVIARLPDFVTNPPGIKKNTALANFVFPMKDTDGNPATGKTVTVELSKDAAAFGAAAGAVAEISAGWYQIDFAQADLNADTIGFKATATGCKPTELTIVTEP